jgi:hypothetical protein
VLRRWDLPQVKEERGARGTCQGFHLRHARNNRPLDRLGGVVESPSPRARLLVRAGDVVQSHDRVVLAIVAFVEGKRLAQVADGLGRVPLPAVCPAQARGDGGKHVQVPYKVQVVLRWSALDKCGLEVVPQHGDVSAHHGEALHHGDIVLLTGQFCSLQEHLVRIVVVDFALEGTAQPTANLHRQAVAALPQRIAGLLQRVHGLPNVTALKLSPATQPQGACFTAIRFLDHIEKAGRFPELLLPEN